MLREQELEVRSGRHIFTIQPAILLLEKWKRYVHTKICCIGGRGSSSMGVQKVQSSSISKWNLWLPEKEKEKNGWMDWIDGWMDGVGRQKDRHYRNYMLKKLREKRKYVIYNMYPHIYHFGHSSLLSTVTNYYNYYNFSSN